MIAACNPISARYVHRVHLIGNFFLDRRECGIDDMSRTCSTSSLLTKIMSAMIRAISTNANSMQASRTTIAPTKTLAWLRRSYAHHVSICGNVIPDSRAKLKARSQRRPERVVVQIRQSSVPCTCRRRDVHPRPARPCVGSQLSKSIDRRVDDRHGFFGVGLEHFYLRRSAGPAAARQSRRRSRRAPCGLGSADAGVCGRASFSSTRCLQYLGLRNHLLFGVCIGRNGGAPTSTNCMSNVT